MSPILGYARVSTGDQDLAGQRQRLRAIAVLRIFENVVSRTTFQRPGLAETARLGVGAQIPRRAAWVGGWSMMLGLPLAPGTMILMPYKHNEPRRHKIPKARYREENWREYEVALRDRGSLTVWVTPEAIAAWHPGRTGRPGRSAHYSDLATGVMLRLAFARPWRQTEGLLRLVTTLLGLSLNVPDHTTLSRRSAALSLVTALAVPAGPVTATAPA
jgi:hypothetical protein